MRNLPPLTELRAFEAAARHLSFKMAAAELGVTPTAISHQIKLLELDCGQALFRRRPRPLTLTRAGERLFPVVRDAFENMATILSTVRSGESAGRLRVTATNAFSARWLLPRLPHWRKSHPRLRLEIIGTDTVLDLRAGEVDLAIRYAREAPRDGPAFELMRDTFFVVASRKLLRRDRALLRPSELARYPLIEADWPSSDVLAPRWSRWQIEARKRHRVVPDLSAMTALSFREELHAIEAVIAGHGIGLCSDVLVAPELADGSLVKVSNVSLPGYGFYAVHRREHLRRKQVAAFLDWTRRIL